MPDMDVIAVLSEHWSDTLRHLSPEDVRVLAETVARVEAAPDDEAASQALFEMLAVLIARLPYDHPVAQAISGRPRYATSAVLDRPRLAGALRSLPGLAGPGVPSPAGPADDADPGALGADLDGADLDEGDLDDGDLDDGDAWLLAAPSLTEHEVRGQGCDPQGPGLIRLSGPGGPTVLPAFQFGRDGRPVPVVLSINRLLDADDDPWGVADWWLGRNGWLAAVPADLLGQVDDALLIEAARAELVGE